MASGQQQQGEELPTARVKLTCWNRDVYEPSDVRDDHHAPLRWLALGCKLWDAERMQSLLTAASLAHAFPQDTFLLVDALQSQAHQWAAKDRCSKPCTCVLCMGMQGASNMQLQPSC